MKTSGGAHRPPQNSNDQLEDREPEHDVENYDVEAVRDRFVSALDARAGGDDDEALGLQPPRQGRRQSWLVFDYVVRRLREDLSPGESGESDCRSPVRADCASAAG